MKTKITFYPEISFHKKMSYMYVKCFLLFNANFLYFADFMVNKILHVREHSFTCTLKRKHCVITKFAYTSCKALEL